MLNRVLLETYKSAGVVGRRNLGISAIAYKQLFVDKVREYGKKSKESGGKLVDSSPELEKKLSQKLDKVAKSYGGGEGVDMTVFPEFSFKDPVIDGQISK